MYNLENIGFLLLILGCLLSLNFSKNKYLRIISYSILCVQLIYAFYNADYSVYKVKGSNIIFIVIMPLLFAISSTPVIRNGVKMFKHIGKDYFRKYNTPEESFSDHANFFFRNKRYEKALLVKSDPYKFIDEIAKAGYATAPNYATVLKDVVKSIAKFV